VSGGTAKVVRDGEMNTILLILGWLLIIGALLVLGAVAALICAASWLRCKNCGGFHDGCECENVDWRDQ